MKRVMENKPAARGTTGSARSQRLKKAQPQTVHFELNQPGARKVAIAGSFNDWKPEAAEMSPVGSGKWAADLALPPGTYEYRLVVDGRWMTDPQAQEQVPNPFGEQNSLLTVPPEPRGQTSQRRISA